MNSTKYFISWFRFNRQDGYMLWAENAESEYYWSDDNQRVLAFKSKEQVVALAQQLGIKLEDGQPLLVNLDVVADWLNAPQKKPPIETLAVWGAFDDLSQSIGEVFTGNVKAPVRNRVFDLLYASAGPWRSPVSVVWPRQERKVLHRILNQGLRLWRKHVIWAE